MDPWFDWTLVAFRYGNNQPVLLIDPTGLACVSARSGELKYVPRGFFKGVNLGPGTQITIRNRLLNNISSAFFADWDPIDEVDYNINFFKQDCCCCDEVGLVQIVRLEAQSDYDPIVGLFSHDWQVDKKIPYPYGTSSAEPRSRPCASPPTVASMSDTPGFDRGILQPQYFLQSFEVCSMSCR